jgi:CBS domain-containing protein
MQAKDIMTTNVITVTADATVRDIARLLLERRISAVPVVDADGSLIGMVSEGDLMRRTETGTERHPSWWLGLLASPDERAIAYVKSHGGHAVDVMTRHVVSVGENDTLEAIADQLEKHHIKRAPVLRDGKIIGIVSRADLLHGLVARQAAPESTAEDTAIRSAAEAALDDAGINRGFVNVVVSGGVVHLWGAVDSDAQKQAARVAAEGVLGVKRVRDQIGVLTPGVRGLMGAL